MVHPPGRAGPGRRRARRVRPRSRQQPPRRAHHPPDQARHARHRADGRPWPAQSRRGIPELVRLRGPRQDLQENLGELGRAHRPLHEQPDRSPASGSASTASAAGPWSRPAARWTAAAGTPRYFGWYEMFPAFPVNFSNPVQPGDHFTGSVTFTGGGHYTLVLKDTTAGLVAHDPQDPREREELLRGGHRRGALLVQRHPAADQLRHRSLQQRVGGRGGDRAAPTASRSPW